MKQTPLVDVNVSCGHWPFVRLPARDLPALDSLLEKSGIKQALVSPLEAVFLPDPDVCNRELFDSILPYQRLLAVPTINLAMPDFLENLDYYRQRAGLKAVKLYPNFHNYSLRSRRVEKLVAYLETNDIRLIINVRLVDERHQYFGLKIKGLATRQIADFGYKYPSIQFLCTGLYLPEIEELAPVCPNFSTDMSFADWHDLIPRLLESLPADRLFFGSHTPLMVTEANAAKLRMADIPESTRRQIGRENAERFFCL